MDVELDYEDFFKEIRLLRSKILSSQPYTTAALSTYSRMSLTLTLSGMQRKVLLSEVRYVISCIWNLKD